MVWERDHSEQRPCIVTHRFGTEGFELPRVLKGP